MVLLLCLNVLQHGLKLTGAHRKRAKSALPEKAAIASVKSFDPFRGRFLYLLDKISLGKSSRQRCDNVDVSATPPMRTNSAPRSRPIVARLACMRDRTFESSQGSRSFVLKTR